MKQWEKDFDKLFVEQGSHRGGKVVREESSKIIDFIRETRLDAVGEVYTFVVNHFTNEQEKFEFFKWWSEKYHPNPMESDF